MNIEQNRLETFQEWPHDAVVSPQRIAKAGFFSTKQDLTVECFSCHATISEWNYGDQVMAKHKTLNPSCPFVINPTTSGNVPIISQPTNVPSSSTTTDSMKDEATRLKTFMKWPIPHIVSPESLARAGFYYLNTGDNTKCAFCKGVVRAWELGDDPDREHKRHFEDCPFVLTEIIPRLNVNSPNGEEHRVKTDSSYSNLHLVANENLHCLGVQTHKGPKKPNYATLESRLRSFAMWPPDLIQTPDILSQSGFYYEGMGDQVRCFHCDGGLRHWDPQDDPWTEHARWFPRCSFIKLVKGQDFVTACSLELNVNSNLKIPHNMPPNIDLCFKPFVRKSKKATCQPDNPYEKESLDMRLECNRLKTYKIWKNKAVTPKALAEAGFYFLNVKFDAVRCAFCDAQICRWEPNDNPLEEHAKISPDCQFAKEKIKQPKSSPSLFSTIQPGQDVCSMETFRESNTQSYSNFQDRLNTFTKWPKSSKQKPKELAEAGFLYSGVSDMTICFSCNGELQDWEDGDDPWEQHALWYPTCEFVKVFKRQEFIKETQSKFDRNSPSYDSKPEVIFSPCVDYLSHNPPPLKSGC